MFIIKQFFLKVKGYSHCSDEADKKHRSRVVIRCHKLAQTEIEFNHWLVKLRSNTTQ